MTVPRGDGGEPLVPRVLPPEVLGCWSADQVTASVTVLASRPSGAVAAVEALVPELARSAGAVVTVRATRAGGAGIARLETARIGRWSWSPRRAALPPVESPCLADEPADGDDRVGEVEERVDDVLVAFVAAFTSG